jgi:hypothetical protein
VAPTVPRPAEPAIRYGLTLPFPGTLAEYFHTWPELALTSFNSAAAVDMDNMQAVVD